jgi:REP element-mobilizing transposase RayT
MLQSYNIFVKSDTGNFAFSSFLHTFARQINGYDKTMAEQERWKWQEPGTTWKGIGLYHITLTIADRQSLLGTLVIENSDPTTAKVVRTSLGNALVDCLLSIPYHHPEVQILHFCLMPDHLHAVLYVRHAMPIGISALVRGFWQATKKLGRAHSVATTFSIASSSSIALNAIQRNNQEEITNSQSIRKTTEQFKAFSESLRKQMGDEAYYQLSPVFTKMPFIRPMGRNTQLPNTIRYIDMNPQRLATKRLKPGLFRVQRDITIDNRNYDGVGNTTILTGEHFEPVHVRQTMVKAAEHGDNLPLRNYMNSCVLKARQGVVMVSPFISTQEKRVMQVLLREQRPFILLADNGFRDYFKPSDILFDACASGRLLILSPWPYDVSKRHITREECVALNAMAEEICHHLST